jgi:peptidoglycan/LPS O-acetylase OafA/YrhL
MATVTTAASPAPLEAVGAPAQRVQGAEFYIPSLDGIRAFSFMLVFFAHAGLGNLVPGGLGVTIFFFLSGYLITTLLRLERDRTSRTSLRDFYLRRAFRILPPFYAILSLAIVLSLVGWLPEPLRWGSVFAQLCHITNYWFVFADTNGFPSGTVVYWSLAVEEHFYLLFPCLFIALRHCFPERQERAAGVLLTLCALVLSWRLLLVFAFHTSEARTGLSSDTRIDSILFGCVLAILGNPVLDRWRGTKTLWTLVLLPAGLLLMIVSLTFRAPWFRETLRYSLQGIALFPIFVTAIRYPDWGPMRALNLKVVRWVGRLSYSLYLCHQVVLFAVERQLFPHRPVVSSVVSFGLALLLAEGMYLWIEKPSARARKAWVRTTWLKPAVS